MVYRISSINLDCNHFIIFCEREHDGSLKWRRSSKSGIITLRTTNLITRVWKWLKSKINLDGDSFTAPRNSIQTIKRHNSVGVYYGQLLESQIIEKPIKQENFEYNSEDFPELSCSMSKLKVEETKQIKEKTMSLKEISKKILN